MNGFLAGIRRRIRGAAPDTAASRPRITEPAAPSFATNSADVPGLGQASRAEWGALAPVQRVLGVASAVISHNFADHLATHGNPAFTGGVPARGTGMPILDGNTHPAPVVPGLDSDTTMWDRTINRTTGAKTPVPQPTRRAVPSRNDMGTAPMPRPATARAVRASREGSSVPMAPGTVTASGTEMMMAPGSETASKPPAESVVGTPAFPSGPETSKPSTLSSSAFPVQRVARATSTRSARPALVSAPPLRPTRRLPVFSGRPEDGPARAAEAASDASGAAPGVTASIRVLDDSPSAGRTSGHVAPSARDQALSPRAEAATSRAEPAPERPEATTVRYAGAADPAVVQRKLFGPATAGVRPEDRPHASGGDSVAREESAEEGSARTMRASLGAAPGVMASGQVFDNSASVDRSRGHVAPSVRAEPESGRLEATGVWPEVADVQRAAAPVRDAVAPSPAVVQRKVFGPATADTRAEDRPHASGSASAARRETSAAGEAFAAASPLAQSTTGSAARTRRADSGDVPTRRAAPTDVVRRLNPSGHPATSGVTQNPGPAHREVRATAAVDRPGIPGPATVPLHDSGRSRPAPGLGAPLRQQEDDEVVPRGESVAVRRIEDRSAVQRVAPTATVRTGAAAVGRSEAPAVQRAVAGPENQDSNATQASRSLDQVAPVRRGRRPGLGPPLRPGAADSSAPARTPSANRAVPTLPNELDGRAPGPAPVVGEAGPAKAESSVQRPTPTATTEALAFPSRGTAGPVNAALAATAPAVQRTLTPNTARSEASLPGLAEAGSHRAGGMPNADPVPSPVRTGVQSPVEQGDSGVLVRSELSGADRDSASEGMPSAAYPVQRMAVEARTALSPSPQTLPTGDVAPRISAHPTRNALSPAVTQSTAVTAGPVPLVARALPGDTERTMVPPEARTASSASRAAVHQHHASASSAASVPIARAAAQSPVVPAVRAPSPGSVTTADPVRMALPFSRAGRSKPQTIHPVTAPVMPGVLITPVQRSAVATPSTQAAALKSGTLLPVPSRITGAAHVAGADRPTTTGQQRPLDHPLNEATARAAAAGSPSARAVPSRHTAVSAPAVAVQRLRAPSPRAKAPAGSGAGIGAVVALAGPGTVVVAPTSPQPRSQGSAMPMQSGDAVPPSPRSAAPGGLRAVAVPLVASADSARVRPGKPTRSASVAVQRTAGLATSAQPAARTTRSSVPATGTRPRVAQGSVPEPNDGTAVPAPKQSQPVQRRDTATAIRRDNPPPGSPPVATVTAGGTSDRPGAAGAPGTNRTAATTGPSGSVGLNLYSLPPELLDALARSLLDPLSRLLRSELRGDRERIGHLRDSL